MPGGGIDAGETPFEAFKREVKEEFNISIDAADIKYLKQYPPLTLQTEFGPAPIGEYFPVVKLEKNRIADIKLGNEGLEYMLISLREYVSRNDAIPVFQERAAEYAESSQVC